MTPTNVSFDRFLSTTKQIITKYNVNYANCTNIYQSTLILYSIKHRVDCIFFCDFCKNQKMLNRQIVNCESSSVGLSHVSLPLIILITQSSSSSNSSGMSSREQAPDANFSSKSPPSSVPFKIKVSPGKSVVFLSGP